MDGGKAIIKEGGREGGKEVDLVSSSSSCLSPGFASSKAFRAATGKEARWASTHPSNDSSLFLLLILFCCFGEPPPSCPACPPIPFSPIPCTATSLLGAGPRRREAG